MPKHLILKLLKAIHFDFCPKGRIIGSLCPPGMIILPPDSFPDGKWIQRDSVGTVFFGLERNRLNGDFQEIDIKGQKRTIGVYARGRETGTWLEYRNDTLTCEIFFTDGFRSEMIQYWFQGSKSKRFLVVELGKGYRIYLMTNWYANGNKQDEGKKRVDKKCGIRTIECRCGTWNYWYENGQLEKKGNYEYGIKVGMWTYYDREGRKIREETYRKGKLVKKEEFESFFRNGKRTEITTKFNSKGIPTKRVQEVRSGLEKPVKTVLKITPSPNNTQPNH